MEHSLISPVIPRRSRWINFKARVHRTRRKTRQFFCKHKLHFVSKDETLKRFYKEQDHPGSICIEVKSCKKCGYIKIERLLCYDTN